MDDDERARLQALAFGPDVDPGTAASARAALQPRSETPQSQRDTAPMSGVSPPERRLAEPDPAPGLQTEPDGRRGARPPRRRRSVLLVASVAVLAFALGAGATAFVVRRATAPASGPTSSTSEITVLARVLGRSQTTADRLPDGLRSGVQAGSSRLVFANSSDHPATPWEAWVASTADGDLCVIASPDRHDATRSCMAKSVAFDATSTVVARAGSDTLTAIVSDGIVDVSLVGRG